MRLITVQQQNILRVNDAVVEENYRGLTMEKIDESYHDVGENVTPAVMPPRVSLALKGRLKEELGRLEKANVIQ